MRTFGAPVAGDPLGLPERIRQQFTLAAPPQAVLQNDEAGLLVEDALGLPRGTAVWGTVPPSGNLALALHLPWARIVIAHSPRQVAVFVREWLLGRRRWLLDTAEKAWPHVAVEWAAPTATLASPLPEAARAFLNWAGTADACGAGARPMVPGMSVRGSWPTWRDGAVFVRDRLGVEEWQVRLLNGDRDWPSRW